MQARQSLAQSKPVMHLLLTFAYNVAMTSLKVIGMSVVMHHASKPIKWLHEDSLKQSQSKKED